MKTGIITFHQALNYGAVLQTYALQKTLQNMNIDCEIIDYSCEKINDDYKAFNIKKCRGKRDYLGVIPYYVRMTCRRKAFQQFNNQYLILSETCNKDNVALVGKKYKCFITGSDQVFNDKCTDLDCNYFLDFVEDNHKKNSYAASFGFQKVPEGLEEKYKKLLKDFSDISVREEKGIQIVKDLIDKQAVRHADPTLILPSDEWKTFVKEKPCEKKYIFMYTVLEPVNAYKFAKQLADEKGLTLIWLHGTIKMHENRKKEKNVKNLYTLSPDEFITYLYHADCVITNSFHGTVFSIIFQKKFVVELETGWNYNHRSEELLRLLGLEHHILNNIDTINLEQQDDWKKVDEYLKKEADNSKKYFAKIIV